VAVAVTSMPGASGPVDVRVTSLPAMPVPTIRMPPDESTPKLVTATWAQFWVTAGLVTATLILAVIGFWTTLRQGRETRKRDRAILTRDLSRAAYRLMSEAERVRQLSALVPAARMGAHTLNGSNPPGLQQAAQKDLKERDERLQQMKDRAFAVVDDTDPKRPSLLTFTDAEQALRLLDMDKLQVQLDVMREAITTELGKYEAERVRVLQERSALHAANVAGRSSQPLKTKLGE